MSWVTRPDGARLAFVTHSIPLAMAGSAGPEPRSAAGAYVDWHRVVAAEVTRQVGIRRGAALEEDLVYCSRSGPPSQPWLEPDVNDHLRALAERRCPGVVLVPIGFISDHMEVIFDLDTEALATAAELGLPCVRAATAGVHPFLRVRPRRSDARAGGGRARRARRPVRWSKEGLPGGMRAGRTAARTCVSQGAGPWSRRLADPSAKPLAETGILARALRYMGAHTHDRTFVRFM